MIGTKNLESGFESESNLFSLNPNPDSYFLVLNPNPNPAQKALNSNLNSHITGPDPFLTTCWKILKEFGFSYITRVLFPYFIAFFDKLLDLPTTLGNYYYLEA